MSKKHEPMSLKDRGRYVGEDIRAYEPRTGRCGRRTFMSLWRPQDRDYVGGLGRHCSVKANNTVRSGES
jgi:hypothetical protein